MLYYVLACLTFFNDSHYPVALMFDMIGLEYFSSRKPLCKDIQSPTISSITDNYLDRSCGIKCTQERIQTLYEHVFNAAHPSMAFIGTTVTDLPFLCYDLQVRWVFSVWTGFCNLPSTEKMITDSNEDYASWKLLGQSQSHWAHLLSDRQWKYFHLLATKGASKPPDCVVKKLHDTICDYKAKGYKTYQFTITGHSSFLELSENKSKLLYFCVLFKCMHCVS